MIRLVSIIFALVSLLPLNAPYACMENGARLYEAKDGGYEEIAVLPSSYYVAVVKENDDGYALVSYMDITGYIKISELTKVDFVPKQKHAEARFTVQNDGQPANLRRSPVSASDNIVAVMPSGAGGYVIGTIDGGELVSGAGTKWYYVRYETGDGYTYGYVYSAHVNSVDFGTCSSEREADGSGGKQDEQGQPKSELSLPIRIVIIAALCLPLLVVMFMLKKKDTPKSNPS